MKVKEESGKDDLKLNIQKTKIMVSSPIASWQIDGKKWKQWWFHFLLLQNHWRQWLQPWNYKMLVPWKKSYDELSILKSRDIILPTKVCIVKAMIFPVVMYGCKSWSIKKAECRRVDDFWAMVLEKTLESPLDSKEIKPVNPKGNQPWIFIGRTVAEAPILWPPNAKSWYIEEDFDVGKDKRQEEKGAIKDEMVGWYHWLNGLEFEQTQGDSEGQGRLACCSSWSRKEWDMTEWTTKLVLTG